MTPETFCEQFATFAEAPNGVAKLRELILQLAVQGKLGTQDVNDEPASVPPLVPQGHTTIAQRFIAGVEADERTSPAGTKEPSWSTRRSTMSPSLPSLRDSSRTWGVVVPAMNRWAIVGQPLAGRGAHCP